MVRGYLALEDRAQHPAHDGVADLAADIRADAAHGRLDHGLRRRSGAGHRRRPGCRRARHRGRRRLPAPPGRRARPRPRDGTGAAPPIRRELAPAGGGTPGVGVGAGGAPAVTPQGLPARPGGPCRPALQDLVGRLAVDRLVVAAARSGSPPSPPARSSGVIVPMRERGGQTLIRSTMLGHAVRVQRRDQRLADAELGDHVLRS